MSILKSMPVLFRLGYGRFQGCPAFSLQLQLLRTSTIPILNTKSVDNPCKRMNSINNYSSKCFIRQKCTATGVPAQTEKLNSDTLLETWFYKVSPWGSIKVNIPFDTVIKPLPPHEYPEMDKVIVQLHYDPKYGDKVPDSYKLSEISDIYEYSLSFDEDKANMNLNVDLPPGVTLPIVCHLQVPINFDLNMNMLDKSNVSIEKMESNSITLETDKGDCYLKSIKCGGTATVTSKSGNIVSKSTLLGNVALHTGQSGTIQADKMQGSTIRCETEMGSVNVKSLYCGKATFKTNGGDIQLGNLHGHIHLQAQNSNVKVESLEGDLDASIQAGSVDVYFSKNEKANIEMSTGDVVLSFSERAETDLNLACSKVVVDEKITLHVLETSQPHHVKGFIGGQGVSQTNVKLMSGNVHLNQLDWIQTTKLASFLNRVN